MNPDKFLFLPQIQPFIFLIAIVTAPLYVHSLFPPFEKQRLNLLCDS